MGNQQLIECLAYALRKDYSYLLIYFILTAVIQSKYDPFVLMKKLKLRVKSWPKLTKLTVAL